MPSYLGPVAVDEAGVIVAGKVLETKESTRGEIPAVIEVNKVFRGEVKEKKIVLELASELFFGQFKVGDTGIWLLSKNAGKDTYTHRGPILGLAGDPKEDKWEAHFEELMASRTKVSGGKAVDGLELRAERVEKREEVLVSLKNVSDKPVVVRGGKTTVTMKLADGAGKVREEKVEHRLGMHERGEEPASQTIAPGAALYLWTKNGPFHLGEEDVKKQITVTFECQGEKNDWTGKVVSNQLKAKE